MLLIAGLALCAYAARVTEQAMKNWRGEVVASRTSEVTAFAVAAAIFVSLALLADMVG